LREFGSVKIKGYIEIDGGPLTIVRDVLTTRGSVLGGKRILSTSTNPYALDITNAYGAYIFYTAAGEIDLPAGSTGMHILVYSTTANEVLIDPNLSEVIVLNGTALTAGNRISVSGSPAAGDYIKLVHNGTNWYTIYQSGTWADKGS
jgi:hypothetical protein